MERASLEKRLQLALASDSQDDLLEVPHPATDHSDARHDDRYLDLRIRPFTAAGVGHDAQPQVLLSVIDATQRHVLEEQARQRSKLESIGTLAGGVAHDFNNVLTGIIGYTSILLEDGLGQGQEREYLEHVNDLAHRAAGLTRQLLMFSRKHTPAPTVIGINSCIEGLAKMLHRVLGEDVELQVDLAADVAPVRADPTHIEQIVMNLVLNARDALADGGRIMVETSNVLLDEGYARRHVGVTPGLHVMIAVSDTGCGMDEATRARIFEPFFTTKEVGKGTGLGLATVHGIVHQLGGSIWVYSEPGRGTSFKIHLPTVTEITDEPVAPLEDLRNNRGEMVLVAEDEEAVLVVVRDALRKRGYVVLTASGPTEAEGLFEEHVEAIALLVTDVVMPGMAGPALYERLAATKPSLKVLYVSGYTERAAVGGSAVPEGAPFLQKPFTPAAIAQKVREVLGDPVEAVLSS